MTPRQPQSCSLLKLPAELRVRIYEYTLAPTRMIHLTSSAARRRVVSPTISPALLATCQQIHREAREILYAENCVCIVIDGQAFNAPAVAESRLPQRVLEKLKDVCLIFDCTATFRTPFTELDLDALTALSSVTRVRIAVLLRTDDDAGSAAMRASLDELMTMVLQRIPATASVQWGVEADSAQARLTDALMARRQKTFRREQRIVVVNVDKSQLAQMVEGEIDVVQGFLSGQISDVFAAYR